MSTLRFVVAALVFLALARPAHAGPPDYDSFSDRDGRITTKEHGLGLIKLVSNTAELEAVYEDARKGSARAKRIFDELETSYFPDTGRELADLVSRPPCLVPLLRELSGWCVPDWSFLDFLSKEKPGGVRLRVALLNGYMERARQRNLENQLILSAMNAVLGASVVSAALREAGSTASASVRSPGTAGFKPPRIFTNRQGQLTNGSYTVDASGMAPHKTGATTGGKSQFLSSVDAEKATLDAAAYADEAGLWVGNKAKVYVTNGPVGVVGATGERTNWINVYRTKTGFVHGSPGSPQ